MYCSPNYYWFNSGALTKRCSISMTFPITELPPLSDSTKMPSVTIHPPSPNRDRDQLQLDNPLPNLLQTPSGLAILELQGIINMPNSSEISSNEEADTIVGRIVFPDYHEDDPPDNKAWMKKVYLYVGRHQRLTGEVRKLNSPVAIIRKRATVGDSNKEELEIAEIVDYKILFSSRPEPVGQEAPLSI